MHIFLGNIKKHLVSSKKKIVLVMFSQKQNVLVNIAQFIWTMHNICKVWGSNLGHHKKIKMKDILSYFIEFLWLFPKRKQIQTLT